MKYSIISDYIVAPSKRRSGIKIPEVLFIVAHDTGNDGSTARQNVNYFKNSRDAMSASAHIFVDDNEIIECIPATTADPEKAWHVRYDKTEDNKIFGEDANDASIGVELCYSKSTTNINNLEAYKRYVWTIAYLCYKYALDPRQKITGHYVLDPQRRTDPVNALSVIKKSFQDFIDDVYKEYIECTKSKNVKVPARKVKKTKPKTEKEPIGELTVTAYHLNIREEPDFNSKIVRVANKGDVLKVYTQKNGLFKVHPTENQWTSSNRKYVSFRTIKSSSVIGRITVKAYHLNVRSAPDFSSSIVKVINNGESYNVYSQKNGLYKIHPTKEEWASANSKYVKYYPLSATTVLGTATIAAYHLNVRSAPDFNSSIVRVVDKGNKFNVFEKKNGLLKIHPTRNEWISANSEYVRYSGK
jgi:N-acetylmuramoyl-L-alanine amidase CwlA